MLTFRRGVHLAIASSLLLVGAISANADQAPAKKTRKMPELPGVGGRVSRIDVHEGIEPGIAAFIGRSLKEHKKEDILLLDINTLGGRLDSALAIRDALLEAEPTTVCWVHPRAISAGAMIALACDIVAIAPGASMGAATPVTIGASGEMNPVEQKVTSYMRQEMANTARMQSRDPLIAEAMVDASVEVPGLDDAAHLLTLDTNQALAWGIADVKAGTPEELWAALGRDVPHVDELKPTGAELFANFVSDPTVAMILMILGLLGIAVEVFHPMHGAALVFGLFCLGLFFFGHHVVNLAGWWELVLILGGLLLIAIEFALPGHTIFGVLGLNLVVAGLFLALVSLDHLPIGIAWETGIVPRALSTVFGALLITLGGGAALVRYGPRTRYGKALILEAVAPDLLREGNGIGLEALVGQVGVAITDLRPIGKISVINKKVEAKLERGFVNAGAKVKVLRVEADRVVVREHSDERPEPEVAAS